MFAELCTWKLIAFLTPDFQTHFGLFGIQFTIWIVYDGKEKHIGQIGVWSVWARKNQAMMSG